MTTNGPGNVALRGCEEIQSGPRWWSLRGETEERGGGDGVTSLTTSDSEIAPQPPPARRVAGGTRPSALLRLLPDVPASPRRRASRLASSRPQRGPLWIFSQPLNRGAATDRKPGAVRPGFASPEEHRAAERRQIRSFEHSLAGSCTKRGPILFIST